MRAKRQDASMRLRVCTAIAMLAVVVLIAILGAAHHGSTVGSDPCASGGTSVICEEQRAIDRQHETENVAAASAE